MHRGGEQALLVVLPSPLARRPYLYAPRREAPPAPCALALSPPLCRWRPPGGRACARMEGVAFDDGPRPARSPWAAPSPSAAIPGPPSRQPWPHRPPCPSPASAPASSPLPPSSAPTISPPWLRAPRCPPSLPAARTSPLSSPSPLTRPSPALTFPYLPLPPSPLWSRGIAGTGRPTLCPRSTPCPAAAATPVSGALPRSLRRVGTGCSSPSTTGRPACRRRWTPDAAPLPRL